ncbi:type II secretion system protein [Desulfoscipio geothermicus]|uniref:Prepilin-type N-terminal cleavage/methylation domain-containing protein n=1 Tax=Desulfoscipio geothermicus DSM 3669 TaxID=1121426 RepID=A0A1I6DBJ0_9FIRM|nr:type II secretion system protein [Desulfoscipio geothermicus]SFR02814.1 prepilin-type N-terminal cleavage/methylation domain-containing protein [Desulfoscipio geothermicus DSM 3669]
MIKHLQNSRGFTLIELMLVTGILGIFFSIIYNFLGFNFKFMDRRNDEHESYLQARIAMNRVENLLQQYNHLLIDSGTVIGIRALDDPNDEPDPENQFKDPLINFNKNTSDVSGYKYYYLYDAAKQIGRIKSRDGNIVAGGIKEFVISPDPENTAVIDIKIYAVNTEEPDAPGLLLNSKLRTGRQLVDLDS